MKISMRLCKKGHKALDGLGVRSESPFKSQTEDCCLVIASAVSGYMLCLILRDPYHQMGHSSVRYNT